MLTTALTNVAEFLLQLQESSPVADLEQLVMIEESLDGMNQQLAYIINVCNTHSDSERKKMESMRAQWQQTLDFSSKSAK